MLNVCPKNEITGKWLKKYLSIVFICPSYLHETTNLTDSTHLKLTSVYFFLHPSPMNQLPFKRILIIGVISILGICLSAKQKPNIVLMFIDDMGYGDIGPFGNKINQTPHLDRMAKEGNVLTNFMWLTPHAPHREPHYSLELTTIILRCK